MDRVIALDILHVYYFSSLVTTLYMGSIFLLSFRIVRTLVNVYVYPKLIYLKFDFGILHSIVIYDVFYYWRLHNS